jgi:hypothetical protein
VSAIDENANKLLNNTISVAFNMKSSGFEAIKSGVDVLEESTKSVEGMFEQFASFLQY